MTVFGWDTSSHDDTPTSLDGLSFFTCKITDGDHYYENPTAAAKLNAMKGFGCEILGTYHVLWGNRSIENQAAWYIQMMDARIPWWRDFPYFICQSDNEPFYSGQTVPSIAQINEFHHRVADLSGGKIPLPRSFGYSPKWVYGAALSGQEVGWWQSDYGSNPSGHYPSVYPGDQSSRWSPSVSKSVFFLQYGSNTTIAGQTTSDANAFRGSLDDLKTALGGDMSLTQEEHTQLYNTAQLTYEALILGNDTMGASLFLGSPPVQTDAVPIMLVRKVNDLEAQVAELKTMIEALSGGGTPAPPTDYNVSLSGSVSGLTGAISITGSATAATPEATAAS
jgi:hypothetical protein